MKLQNSTSRNSSILAMSLLGGLSVLVTACSSGDTSKVKGQFAPQTATASKLEACSKAKLSGSLQTYESSPAKVCRKGAGGEKVDQDVIPSFQMLAKKGRIGLDHVVAFQATYEDSVIAAMSAEAKLTSEAAIQQFLAGVCGPVLQAPFKRSGLATRFTFRPLRPTDRKALPKAGSSKSSTSNDDSLFDGTSGARAEALQADLERSEDKRLEEQKDNKTFDKQNAGQRKTDEREARSRQEVARPMDSDSINSILELVVGADLSISIKDDLSEVSSGSLKEVLSGQKAPSEQQALFCGQLLIRLAENVGLTKGRDCASLETAPETPAETSPKDESGVATDESASKGNSGSASGSTSQTVAKKPTDGLMKPGGHPASALASLKLADAEVLEIMTPICGDLNTVTPAGKNP